VSRPRAAVGNSLVFDPEADMRARFNRDASGTIAAARRRELADLRFPERRFR